MVFTKNFIFTLLALIPVGAVPQAQDPLKTVEIVAPDGSARATFIPHGATLTGFWVKDKKGAFRDVAVGFDNTTNYKSLALGHTYFGPIVGRYANRIRNGTYTIPITKNASGPNKFHAPQNEGNNTLHGGVFGFDQHDWTTVKHNKNSISFSMLDPDGSQGFPGDVYTTVTYTLERHSTFDMAIHATATKKTPIMLSGHHYWNLEAYQETEDLSGHFAVIRSSKYVETDTQLIPTGKLATVESNPMDFRKAKSIGNSIPLTAEAQYCGPNCVGYDNAWVFDGVTEKEPSLSIWSTNSGIKLDIFTNQKALQIYTCNGILNPSLPIPRKKSQGGPDKNYINHSCIVLENEGIIDAINNPEFHDNQIYGPGNPYNWHATYKFSTVQ